MPLHAHFEKQVSVKNKNEKQKRRVSCWNGIVSFFYGSRNTNADTSTGDEASKTDNLSVTLEDGLTTVPAAAAGAISSEIIIKNGSGDGADHHLGDGDEIIMFGDNFVLTISHEDLLKQFYNLKVDGQSTFVMMIRRKEKPDAWKVLEVFRILSSCDGSCELTAQETTNKNIENESDRVYRVHGTQLYMQIDNSGLRAKTLSGDSGDKTKVICRRTVFCEDDNGPRVEVTLRDKTLGRHISFCVENRQIVLSDKPQSFKYTLSGDKAHFMSSEGYLAYDKNTNMMVLQEEKFAFDELTVTDHL